MHRFLQLLQRLFLFGRGRPVAIIILLWTTTLSVVSEMQQDDSLAEISGTFVRPFSSARQFLFDSYQRYYPRPVQSQPVMVVAIDEPSLAQIGQWPWPRNKLAELVDAIAAHGPAATGFDMYMPERDQTSPDRVAANLPPGAPENLVSQLRMMPGHEARLAEALRKTPSVLGAAGFDFSTQTSRAGLRTAPLLVTGGDALPHVRHFDAVLASLPELQAAAWGQAVLSVELEFGVVRRIPLVVAVGGELVSGLAMEMLRVATGSTAVEVEVDGQGIRRVAVADLSVPTQTGGEIWLHYARTDATAARYVSAVDVLEGAVAPDLLASKLVLIGLTGSGLQDMRTTALRELVPGIEIQAQLLETLFDNRFLLRPWWIKWLEIGTILLLGCYLVWFVPRTDSRLAAYLKSVPRASLWLTLALNASLISAGYLLFRYQGLLFDASSFFIILSGTMGSLVSSAMIEIDREAKEEAGALQHRRERAHLGAGKLLGLIRGRTAVEDRQARVGRLARLLAEAASQHPDFTAQLTPTTIEALGEVAALCDYGLPPVSVLPPDSAAEPQGEPLQRQHRELGGIALEALRESKEYRRNEADLDLHLGILGELIEARFECWDGSGYPRGISGDAIPLPARILAVIDAYDGLLRGVGKAHRLSHPEAMERIRSASGAQFDPRLVECLARCKLSSERRQA